MQSSSFTEKDLHLKQIVNISIFDNTSPVSVSGKPSPLHGEVEGSIPSPGTVDNQTGDFILASLPRMFVKADIDQKPKPGEYPTELGVITSEEEANLVSSKLTYEHMNLHAPALDVDHKVECYESSTPGHYHILIDVPMRWWKYKMLMWWMYKCGILEKGYYKASAKKKASYLRKKGILKPDAKIPSENAGIIGVGYIAAEKDKSSVMDYLDEFMKDFKSENAYNIPMKLISEKQLKQAIEELDNKVKNEAPVLDSIEKLKNMEPKQPPHVEEWQTWQ